MFHSKWKLWHTRFHAGLKAFISLKCQWMRDVSACLSDCRFVCPNVCAVCMCVSTFCLLRTCLLSHQVCSALSLSVSLLVFSRWRSISFSVSPTHSLSKIATHNISSVRNTSTWSAVHRESIFVSNQAGNGRAKGKNHLFLFDLLLR